MRGEGWRRLGRVRCAAVGVVKAEVRVDVCLAGDRLVGVRSGAERGSGVNACVVRGIHLEAVAVQTTVRGKRLAGAVVHVGRRGARSGRDGSIGLWGRWN